MKDDFGGDLFAAGQDGTFHNWDFCLVAKSEDDNGRV